MDRRQLSLLPAVPAGSEAASPLHSTPVEIRARRPGSLIRRALLLDQEDAFSAGEVGFLARALVQATLPHSDPGDSEFVRRNGCYTLSILALREVGLPYGRYPRLVLAYLCTEAVRRKSRCIELDRHFSTFCAGLGVVPTTGPRGSLPMLRDQMQRLFSASFRCTYEDRNDGGYAGEGFFIAEQHVLWWDPKREEDGSRWGARVSLSERFFREATEAPVPLDLRVLRALRSPLEIDIYVWLTWRLFRLRRPVTISWPSLMLQFGCGYRNPRHFKGRFLGYLRTVIRWYPEARLEATSAGLVLKPSPPHVAPKPMTPMKL